MKHLMSSYLWDPFDSGQGFIESTRLLYYILFTDVSYNEKYEKICVSAIKQKKY